MKKKLILLTMAGAILASGIQADTTVAKEVAAEVVNNTDAILEQVFNKAAEIAGIVATASKEIVLAKAEEIAQIVSKLDDESLKTAVLDKASEIAGMVTNADGVWDKASEIAELVANASGQIDGEELFNQFVEEATPAAIVETVTPEVTSWFGGLRSGASELAGKASAKFGNATSAVMNSRLANKTSELAGKASSKLGDAKSAVMNSRLANKTSELAGNASSKLGNAKSAVSEVASAKYADVMNSNFVSKTVPTTWTESTEYVKDHPIVTAAVVVGTAATLYLGYKYFTKKKKDGGDGASDYKVTAATQTTLDVGTQTDF